MLKGVHGVCTAVRVVEGIRASTENRASSFDGLLDGDSYALAIRIVLEHDASPEEVTQRVERLLLNRVQSTFPEMFLRQTAREVSVSHP